MSAATTEKAAQRSQEISIRIIAWSVAILALIAVIAAAKFASAVILPVVLAGLIAVTLTPLVDGLEKLRVPVTLAAAVVVCSGVVGTIGGAYLLAPSVEDWRSRAPSIIRSVERQFRNIEREITKQVDQVTAGSGKQTTGDDSPTDVVIASGQQLATDLLLSTPEMLASFLTTAFLCFYFLAARAPLRRTVVALVSDWKTRLRISRAMLDMRRNVGYYLLTITSINVLLGIATGVVFWLLDLPNAALWGVMVGLLNFMPYLGPLIANLIIFAVGVASFNNLTESMYPVLALAAINIVEGQVVTPMIVGQRARVGALPVFLVVIFGAWLWGALGALVAA
ncbi:MAG: AI-2E family transporter, partial [Desulfobacterales bacterium]|nr:AI-2E family transporter [Desulfobacterales bacterium]